MDFETLTISLEGDLARLSLNRPERLNALGPTMMNELIQAAHWLDTQHDIRVVILSGNGRSFSAGADLKESANDRQETTPWHVRREATQLGTRLLEAMTNMRAVTVAQVHGYSIGGGVLLMFACDLRVVAKDSIFIIPEVELGIPLAWGGIPRLVREIGPALTKELVMTCRRFGPADIAATGALNRIVSRDALESSADELARQLLRMPSAPVVITKEHVNAVADGMAASRSVLDGDVLWSALAAPESAEARSAYLERSLGGGKNSTAESKT